MLSLVLLSLFANFARRKSSNPNRCRTMKKYLLDLSVRCVSYPRPGYVLLQLTTLSGDPLPEMQPGQFVEVRVDGSATTFLRRPISINRVDREANELWLLVHIVGEGTRWMASLSVGDVLNVMLPLGRGFTLPSVPALPSSGLSERCLLVGGGVGTAPLLYLGEMLSRAGACPMFLLGARTHDDLLQLDLFRRLGEVCVTTEDGSAGERGFVTQHSIWQTTPSPTLIYTCGPKPMMQAVARMARERHIPCEASLENLMACGLGACLCCVEDTVDGHVCVCQQGPVFSTDKLKW